ncbi:hypothetical protein BY996DRAFT_8402737 [Phakopsora pachyrhizi]|nr:hypothetical protein BY996DRAFT_8402737 [Phakopsora pachyrhizi]
MPEELRDAKDRRGVEVVDLMMTTAISRYNQRSKELVSIEKILTVEDKIKSFPAIKSPFAPELQWNPVRIEHQSDVDSNRSKEFKTAEEPGTDETNQNQTQSERSLSKGFHGSWERAGIAGGQRIGDQSLSQIPADQKTQKNKVDRQDRNWPTYRMVEREVIDGESQSKAMKLEKQLLLC